jgi:hypothetical protein
MKELGKSIRLFLVDGSPSGLITAEIMNWTGKVLSFPRGLLPQALKRPEIAKTGVYFLVGADPEQFGRFLVYIGESDDVARRLKQHDGADDKDFFEQVALIVSKDENLTKGHVRYLENRLIELTQNAGAARLFNGTQGSQVSLPESEQSDMEYVLQQLQVLLPVLGFTFLQEPPKRPVRVQTSLKILYNVYGESKDEEEAPLGIIFELSYLNGQVRAEAYELEGQFIVMAGAIGRHPDAATKPLKQGKYAYILENLKNSLSNGTLTTLPDVPSTFVELTRDKAFKSPSQAASFLCANPVSGPIYWKVKGSSQTYGEWRKEQLEQVGSIPPLQDEVLV